MGICNIAHLREPQRWKGLTMALPTMEVSSTNNVCVGKAITGAAHFQLYLARMVQGTWSQI
jgi:hypothetical protein